MRVLLRDDVQGLGKRGDIVDVAGGFARNHLLPTGRALKATDSMSDQAAAMRRARDLRDAKDREAAETVAGVLGGKTVTLTARAAAEGRLFGSVGPHDLAEAISAQSGATVDRKQVVLEEPIKALGSYTVPVRLHAEVTAEVAVEIVAAG